MEPPVALGRPWRLTWRYGLPMIDATLTQEVDD
jgi:hypothetical protein